MMHAETIPAEPLAPEPLARETLDGLAAHIAILDENGTIIAVNHAWRAFAEVNSSDSCGVGIEARVRAAEGANYLATCDQAIGDSSEEAPLTAAGIRAVIAGDAEVFTLEYPCHSPSEQRWFCLRVTRFPGAGPARAIISHEDITPRKLIEESLKQRVQDLAQITERLERRNQELDQFAYVISHDLKAPLRGIGNLSRWIEEDLGEALSEEVGEHLQLLRGRVSRMEAMIEGILQYSRIERVSIKRAAVNIAELIEEVIDLVDPPESFQIEISPEMPTITTERLRLEQVFLNLLTNAIKHNDKPQGWVRISVRDAGDFYEFSVRDNGPGIAPQYHEKVFQIFQTLEARDKVENTGVGLALVKKIVESQWGRVRLISDLGQGADFIFTWPKQPKGER